jgi:hypothetical protein
MYAHDKSLNHVANTWVSDRMAYHSLLIHINRPLLCFLGLPHEERLVQVAARAHSVCSTSAIAVIHLGALFNEHYTLRCAVFMVAHWLTNACTVLFVSPEMLDDRSNGDLAAFEEGLELLREMARAWEVGRKAVATIDNLKRAGVHPAADGTRSAWKDSEFWAGSSPENIDLTGPLPSCPEWQQEAADGAGMKFDYELMNDGSLDFTAEDWNRVSEIQNLMCSSMF